jgi:hypothetical protein
VATLYLYSAPVPGVDEYVLATDITEPESIESPGFFRVAYTTIFEYSDTVKDVAYWSTGLDRWVLSADGRTFTDFTIYERLIKEDK